MLRISGEFEEIFCCDISEIQGTAKVVSFYVVFKKSAAEQCLAEVVSFWLPAS